MEMIDMVCQSCNACVKTVWNALDIAKVLQDS